MIYVVLSYESSCSDNFLLLAELFSRPAARVAMLVKVTLVSANVPNLRAATLGDWW